MCLAWTARWAGCAGMSSKRAIEEQQDAILLLLMMGAQ